MPNGFVTNASAVFVEDEGEKLARLRFVVEGAEEPWHLLIPADVLKKFLEQIDALPKPWNEL